MPSQTLDVQRCTRCGVCVQLCPSRIYVQTDGTVAPDESLASVCVACGHCVAACPAEALTVTGVAPGAPPLPTHAASADDLMALMLRRRSTRAFTDEPVPRDLLQRLVDAAATAPMAFPPSVVEVTVLTERAEIAPTVLVAMAQLEELAQMSGNGFGRLMLRLMAGPKTARLLSDYLMPLAGPWLAKWRETQEDYITWGAPALLLFHSAGDSPVGETDAVIAATHAQLMAEAQGLGAVMLGFASAAISRDKHLRERYGLPPGHNVWHTLAVGYPRYRFQRTIARELKQVHWV